MKVVLDEKQLRLYKKFLTENIEDEGRSLSVKQKRIIDPHVERVTKELFGKKYGERDERASEVYKVDVTYDGEIATGLFSLGNSKLSDDTMIINFTSALECPSINVCPITQKACYAVAGETRFKDSRRKNLKVQNIWREAMNQAIYGDKNAVDKVFSIARLYIETLNAKKDNGNYVYKKPIRYVRFNEVGDFFTQSIVNAAADFAAFAKQYGVMCMAYTANKYLNFKAIHPGTGLPVDKLIKINASRTDIKVSDDTTKQNFFATPMDYKTMLVNNDKVEEINDGEEENLKCLMPIKGEHGVLSVPLLTYGKSSGGEGWYYVCPRSFWKYNKDKAESEFYQNIGITDEDVTLDTAKRRALKKELSPEVRKKLDRVLNKIKSPCGVECAVCHDMEGGITPDGERITNYAVLTAVHGSGAGNYNPGYALAMRMGRDREAQWSEENPRGHQTSFDPKGYMEKKRKEKAEKSEENNDK
jgi:hypothetical protein